ncbi:hypothetical protein CspHIS471_0304260 [Cutaneotrichosporon sp. HIS471]|nr:hypothetical protein CspHIS471_0304260 [Cutaneotrichosporon sp. HIS471]
MAALPPLSNFTPRRPLLIAGFATLLFIFFLAHSWGSETIASYVPWRDQNPELASDVQVLNSDTQRRLDRLRKECQGPDPFEAQYSRANLRMTRGYEGSLARLERVIYKILRGEPVKVGIIGGSVTRGHGVQEHERWPDQLNGFLKEFYAPKSDIPVINGASPATGSDYFSYCFALHIPDDVDLVIVELGINDVGEPEDLTTMEDLLRGLLDMQSQPAVMLLEVLGFSGGGMGGAGGRYHLPIAQYYDVPVINQRHPTASHFARFPDIMPHYFDINGYGETDMRHLNSRGHLDASNIIASMLRDTTCGLVNNPSFRLPPANPPNAVIEKTAQAAYDAQADELYGDDVEGALATLEADWSTEEKTWMEPYQPPKDDTKGEEGEHKKTYRRPGMWQRRVEHGLVPRMEFLAGWNPDPNYRRATSRPTCYSTKATEARFNLTPSYADGWEFWLHPDHNDKPYVIAREPGARVTFEIPVHAGTIKMYYLRSERMSLGKIRCWIDDDEAAGKEGILLNGWWKRDWINIGQYTTLAENLPPGVHRVNCVNLNETDTTDGGHDFRIISLVSS